jgi:hypothetical protein
MVVPPVIEAVGFELTVTVAETDLVQPPVPVTVTVYVVLTVGLTVIAAVVAPVFQEYVVPPLAVSVVLAPLQIVVVPAMAALGNGLTVTAAEAVAVQPKELVTVTV